jgi:hypothetical protein
MIRRPIAGCARRSFPWRRIYEAGIVEMQRVMCGFAARSQSSASATGNLSQMDPPAFRAGGGVGSADSVGSARCKFRIWHPSDELIRIERV